MILVVVFVVASIVIGATFIAKTLRAHRTPSELRGDWWSRFESEFRDYTRRTSGAKRPRRGRHNR
jgi:hypothetical protein